MARTVTLEILQQEFEVFPERAVLYRRRKALLVSDLHWGRESFMQSRGIAVPDLALRDEIERLDRVLLSSQARELWILGDWIHHPKGMNPALIERMEGWIEGKRSVGLRIRFVPGNHDRGISAWLKKDLVELEPEGIHDEGFRFDHEETRPGDGNGGASKESFVICGHLHPAFRFRSAVDDLKLPCFWVRRRVAYLPAFSSLAGGAQIRPDFGRGDRVVVLAPEGVELLQREGRAAENFPK